MPLRARRSFAQKDCLMAWAQRVLLALLMGTGISAYAQNNIYMLGEVHDNPKVHAQRFAMLEKLITPSFTPAIAMEQFDRENQTALTQAMRSCKDADCVIRKAGGKGWDWNFYKPVIKTALKYRLPLIAANVSSGDAMKVVREGFSAALSPEVQAEYNLDKPLGKELFQEHRKAIDAGHCYTLPGTAFKGMVNAQIARDVWMAKTIRENSSQGIILLAGNGHVRKDIGVFQWLNSAERLRSQVIVYVEDESTTDIPQFDQRVVVEPFKRDDPCEAFTGKVKIKT
jgi:uncharacterized iron-regulated protein